jgi:hypothetical protein
MILVAFTDQLFSPFNSFVLGFVLGCIFLVLSLYSHWVTKREFRRYKAHLSDKLELDAKQVQDTNKEKGRLAQENENLRLQVARLNERSDNKLARELEIFARAEKHMLINAPGFAPAWELAKTQALTQIDSEEKGQSIPQKIFRKLLGSGPVIAATTATTVTALPQESTSKTQEASSSPP